MKLTASSVYRSLTRFGSVRSRRWPSGKETSSATRIISRAKLWKRATRTPKVRDSFILFLNKIKMLKYDVIKKKTMKLFLKFIFFLNRGKFNFILIFTQLLRGVTVICLCLKLNNRYSYSQNTLPNKNYLLKIFYLYSFKCIDVFYF